MRVGPNLKLDKTVIDVRRHPNGQQAHEKILSPMHDQGMVNWSYSYILFDSHQIPV